MEHIAVQFEIVIRWTRVGAVLASDLFTGVDTENVDLQEVLAVEMFRTDGTLERGEGHVSVIALDGHLVHRGHQGGGSLPLPHLLAGRASRPIRLATVSQVVSPPVSVHVTIGGECLTTHLTGERSLSGVDQHVSVQRGEG